MKSVVLFFIVLIVGLPFAAFASISIAEIMYNLKDGSDSGREWVEIFNSGSEAVDLTGWKFYEAETNHKINLFKETDTFLLPAGGYAVIADDPNKFLIDWPNFSGIVFDSSFSLSNIGETITLRNSELADVDSVAYNPEWGANEDNNSLQKINNEWKAAAPTPGAANLIPPESSQQQTQNSSSSAGTSQSSSAGSGSSFYVQPENLPHIKAYAGTDKNVTVGAAVEFRGQAFGLEDEALDNARFLWTFGDGSSKDGKNITHIYYYPGEYIIALNVSSGEYSASDYLLVKASPNQIFISEAKTGENGPADGGTSWVELENKSKEEIDISGCQLRSGNQFFIFPQATVIRPSAFLVIPSSISGIILPQEKGIIELLYSGSFKSDSFSYNGFLQNSQSFNRSANSSLISQETPGAKNSIIIAESKIIPTSANKNPTSVPAKENLEKASEKFLEQDSEKDNGNQGANIIIVGEDDGAKNNTKIYLAVVFGLIIFATAAILFIRRQRGS